VIPNQQHQCILIDALSRSGRLDEAEDLANQFEKSMTSECTQIMWMTMLGACHMVNDDKRAERIAQHIREINPKEASNYVLVANILGKLGNWEAQKHIVQQMKQNKIFKIPGKSWMVKDGKVHHFHAHEDRHPAIPIINKLIKQDLDLMKSKSQYNPDISWVSKNISDEEKEIDLCEHSEKYALYFGLLETSPGTTVTIYKNLRMCGDCHNYTAAVSQLHQREIQVRDAATWHIFKNGNCICNGKY